MKEVEEDYQKISFRAHSLLLQVQSGCCPQERKTQQNSKLSSFCQLKLVPNCKPDLEKAIKSEIYIVPFFCFNFGDFYQCRLFHRYLLLVLYPDKQEN